MEDRSVIFADASPELARAVRVIICRSMAQSLVDCAADLRDDDEVIDALLDDGFGEKSVGALWQDAQRLAAAFSIPCQGRA